MINRRMIAGEVKFAIVWVRIEEVRFEAVTSILPERSNFGRYAEMRSSTWYSLLPHRIYRHYSL
jgi:hypothetical protein